MSSQAIKKDPKSWDELKFQDQAVQLAKKWLSSDQLPNMIFISGQPGVGKTAYAKLLANSLRCETRKAGSPDGCGKCRICTSDPRDSGVLDNIVWVQSGQDETLTRQLNIALEEINSSTYGILPAHRDYKVVVIDEAQRLNRQQLQDLLFFPDLGSRMDRNRVLLIFVTMAEDRIDPVIANALKSRSTYLRFRTPSRKEILELLRESYPSLPPESLNIVARESNGNIRWAHNLIHDCVELDEYLNEETVVTYLQLLSNKDRRKLWLTMQACDARTGAGFKEYRAFWEGLSMVDHAALARQLMEDIELSINSQPRDIQMKALAVLAQYLSGTSPLRLNQVLYQVLGAPVVDLALFSEETSEVERLLSL
jgi:DNA polymerase III delta prime subunit